MAPLPREWPLPNCPRNPDKGRLSGHEERFPPPRLGGRSLGKLTFGPLHPPGSVRFARRRRPHHLNRPPDPLPQVPSLVIAGRASDLAGAQLQAPPSRHASGSADWRPARYQYRTSSRLRMVEIDFRERLAYPLAFFSDRPVNRRFCVRRHPIEEGQPRQRQHVVGPVEQFGAETTDHGETARTISRDHDARPYRR